VNRDGRGRPVSGRYLRTFARWCSILRRLGRFARSFLCLVRWPHTLRMRLGRIAATQVVQRGCFRVRKNRTRTLDLDTARVVRLAGRRDLLHAPPVVLEHQPRRVRVRRSSRRRSCSAFWPPIPSCRTICAGSTASSTSADSLGRRHGERAKQRPGDECARSDAVSEDARERVTQRGLDYEHLREVAVRPRSLVAGARAEDYVRHAGAFVRRGRVRSAPPRPKLARALTEDKDAWVDGRASPDAARICPRGALFQHRLRGSAPRLIARIARCKTGR
jgi:hypothetical protein